MNLEFTPHMCWGTPIVEVRNPDGPRLKEALVRAAYEAEKNIKGPIASGVAPAAKQGLYESPFNFFSFADPAIAELRHFCCRAVAEMVFQLNRQINGERFSLGRINVDPFESWIHITRDGGYHDSHVHPNCSWCGIYYIDIGDCTLNPLNGVNRFYPPVALIYEDVGSVVCPLNPVHPPPEDGKLILFPSHIRHAGLLYHGKRDRILASFNAKVTRAPQQ
jgi:hypothetical protein